MGAKFETTLVSGGSLKTFKGWCQKVLPTVYDDSLSYYETLCKVVDHLNECIGCVNSVGIDISNLHNSYIELQGWVNNYFENENLQEQINAKLDEMAKDGSLTDMVVDFVTQYKQGVSLMLQEQNGKIANLVARMDTFARLPDGSTSGDAELADLRVDINNVTHESAGKAIREQFISHESNLQAIVDELQDARHTVDEDQCDNVGQAIRQQIAMAHGCALNVETEIRNACVNPDGEPYETLNDMLNARFNELRNYIDSKFG